ncbi:MAG: PBECR2 nuclease fold domain-containing protein [Candidatus Bathyarchaeia archaeon]
MPKLLLSCNSVSGKVVHLSKDVWFEKILKNHPEFQHRAEYLEEVKKAIETPDYIVIGWAGEYLALRFCEIAPNGPKHLCVVYKELNGEGFIITTFFISKPHKLLRRGVAWRKLK